MKVFLLYRVIASRIDYTRVSDQQLHKGMIVTVTLGVALLIIGVSGWFKYRRNYVPKAGHFRPGTILLIVVLPI